MVKLRAEPSVDRVTLLALRREAGRNMVGRSRLLVGCLMAGIALDRKPLELPYRLTLVAVRAVQASVSSYEGKPVVVFPHPLKNDTPALYGVALFAVGPHLTAMDVGMAIGAVCSRIREHWFSMALGAGYALVKTAQRVFRLVVIELRNGPDRLPPR